LGNGRDFIDAVCSAHRHLGCPLTSSGHHWTVRLLPRSLHADVLLSSSLSLYRLTARSWICTYNLHAGRANDNLSAVFIATCRLGQGDNAIYLGGQAANTTISGRRTIQPRPSPPRVPTRRGSSLVTHAKKWRREEIGGAFWLVLIANADSRRLELLLNHPPGPFPRPTCTLLHTAAMLL
jgi:hypothetical protein